MKKFEIFKIGIFLPCSGMWGSQAKSGLPTELGVVGHSPMVTQGRGIDVHWSLLLGQDFDKKKQ